LPVYFQAKGIWYRDGLNDPSLISGRSKRFFFTAQYTERLWGPPNHLFNGYHIIFFQGVKRQRHVADYSPSSIAEAKNDGAIHPLPHAYSWRVT
jgi:hypothetical protein